MTWQDGFVSIVAPEDGTYIILAREAAYAGNANCLYRLHVGDFPRPTATLPAGGKFGEPVTVRWIGDVLGEKTTSLTCPATPIATSAWSPTTSTGPAPYPNAFRLSPFGNTIEAEPNDTHATATPFTPPVALNGVIGTRGMLTLTHSRPRKGRRTTSACSPGRSARRSTRCLNIFGKNAGRVAGNDDSGGPDSYVRFTAPQDGEFVISVADHLKKGGPDYAYRVEISPVDPRLS